VNGDGDHHRRDSLSEQRPAEAAVLGAELLGQHGITRKLVLSGQWTVQLKNDGISRREPKPRRSAGRLSEMLVVARSVLRPPG